MTYARIGDRLSWIAALFATLAAAAGLLVAGLYRDAPFWIDQARGTDVATLFLAVPILVGGLLAARRGSTLGRLVALAGLLYLVYNYAIFSFSVAINPLSAMYIAILGLAVWSLFLELADLDLAALARSVEDRLPRRTTATAVVVVAALFGLLWLGQIASVTASGVLPPDLVRANLPTNPIYALDLAMFLPLCVLVGAGLLRGSRLGGFALPMLIWLSLTSAAVLAGFAIPALRGEALPIAPAVMVGAIGIVTTVLAALAFRPRRAVRRVPHAMSLIDDPAT